MTTSKTTNWVSSSHSGFITEEGKVYIVHYLKFNYMMYDKEKESFTFFYDNHSLEIPDIVSEDAQRHTKAYEYYLTVCFKKI